MGKQKLELGQLIKNAVAYAGISAITAETTLLLIDNVSNLDFSAGWYYNIPLAVWSAAGIPVSIALAGRLKHQVDVTAGQIWGFQEGDGPGRRAIPITAGGQPRGTILASTMASIFGEKMPAEEETPEYRPAVWKVPAGESVVSVRESELRAFLDTAWKRNKHQFSRRYWTEKRRPPLWRGKYDAYMRLLVETGIVEGRHASGGASGRLVLFPREAIWYLKYESQFRVT